MNARVGRVSGRLASVGAVAGFPEHARTMGFDVEALFRLWTDPLPEGPAAEDAVRTLYTDPVVVNGVPLTAADLVSRARAIQGVFEPIERKVLDLVEDDGKVAVAFRLGGRQVGPLPTAAGIVPPSGQPVTIRPHRHPDVDQRPNQQHLDGGRRARRPRRDQRGRPQALAVSPVPPYAISSRASFAAGPRSGTLAAHDRDRGSRDGRCGHARRGVADTDDEVGIWSWCHIDRSRTGGIRKRRVTSSMM